MSTLIAKFKLVGLLALCCLISSCAFFGSDDPVFRHDIYFPKQDKLDYWVSFEINQTKRARYPYRLMLKYDYPETYFREMDNAMVGLFNPNLTSRPIRVTATIVDADQHMVLQSDQYQMSEKCHGQSDEYDPAKENTNKYGVRFSLMSIQKGNFELKPGRYRVELHFQSNQPYPLPLRHGQIEISSYCPPK